MEPESAVAPIARAIVAAKQGDHLGFPVYKTPPPCRVCSGPVKLVDVGVDGFPKLVALSVYCVACAMKIKASEARDRREAENKARREVLAQRWLSFGPEGQLSDVNDYRETEEERLPVPHAVRSVLAWKPAQRGLIIYGETGKGKTRMIYALSRRLIFDFGIMPLLWTGPGFRNQVSAAARSGEPQDRPKLLRRMTEAPVLIIDDLGQAAASDASEEALWEVVEARTSARKPIIVTTQFIGETLRRRFLKVETADAVIRRLAEHCDTIRAAQI